MKQISAYSLLVKFAWAVFQKFVETTLGGGLIHPI